jgi:Tol biopolymer transport system component
MRVSPDFSQTAILFAESEELAFNEIRKISTYDFAANEIQNLTDNQCCLYNFSWQPDSQAIIYSQVHDLFVAPLNNTPPEQLTINSSLSPNSEVFNPIISPDGIRLAFTTANPNSLVLYELSSGEYATVGGIFYPSSYLTIAWSPNSEWLAFTNSFNQGLSLVNAESLDTIQLRDTLVRCFPTWATNTSRLAFTCDNTIYLWDDTARTTQELIKAELLGPPAWSPDNSLLAASFTNGDRTGILLTDPVEVTTRELPLNPPVRPAVWAAPVWSPDGDWLLVLSEQTEQDSHSGVYIIDVQNGIPYLIMETTGLQQPYDFTWLTTD